MSLKFNLPLPEKVTANKIYAGMHWGQRTRLVRLYHDYLIGYDIYKGVYPIQITYRFTFAKKPLDTTNCFFMMKMLEDSMTENKIIEDDHYWIVKRTIVESAKGDDDEVEIEIKPYV